MSTTHPTVAKTDFWTADRVAEALKPLASVNLPRGQWIFSRVSTDTRTIEDGDLFVALRGERFDAHDFLKDAVAKGAKGLVVSRVDTAAGLGVPVYEVHDTLVALGALGTYRRRALNKPVVAVVGSNGKTSAKELIKAALGSRLEVHATTGNLNNLIGVPLTLLAMPDDADVAVVEMGTNMPGEIPRLREIVEPDITVVTSIAEEHLEGFGDLAGVLKEEMSATDGVGVAIVPAAQPETIAAAKSRRVVSVGIDVGDLQPSKWSIAADGRGSMTIDGVDVRLPLRGLHNLRNAMLAFAVAREAGVSIEDAGRGIAAMTVPPMRSNVEEHGTVTLINDAYNSNPGSARAAIELLEHAGKGRQRVAVLGSMLELGAATPSLHDDVAKTALDAGIEVVAGIGEFADALKRVATGDSRVVVAPDIEALWSALSSRLAPNAVILLKGSRGMRLERLVTPIAEWSRNRAST
ncbi:MAG TPA: UDP-N-acetylmuramoyl-tripeptide--D-alanyl-D-alanine ligase [Gemmatimonadaceae bacterium]|jgi:UDP-N-acetylmuramoyl-tripeptide--D-alanyl-D-alanine ligase